MLSPQVAMLFLCVSAQVASLNPFCCEDKEVIYDWDALIEAGTLLPAPHTSLCVLKGKINLQTNGNETFVKISEITYKLHNGVRNRQREHTSHSVPLSEEAKELENVFKIVYTKEGLVYKIVTEKNEKEFSRNIKKAIAANLQIDNAVISKDYKFPEGFVVEEDSLRGRERINYIVTPQENSTIEVKKLSELADNALYKDSITNRPIHFWDRNYENPLVQMSKKIYTIKKDNVCSLVKKILNIYSLNYNPHQGKSESHMVTSVQTFHLQTIIPKGTVFNMASEKFDYLSYHTYQKQEDGVIDFTNGRHVFQYDKLIPEVKTILSDIPKYLEENHINQNNPDTKRGQQINRLERLLTKLNAQKLEELGKMLAGNSLKVFHLMLSLITTEAATLYVKNLIVNKIVDESTSVALLQSLPENARPSLSLLEKLEDLIYLNETFNWEVRKAALLSFGTLVHKSYIYTKPVGSKNPYEKYLTEYVNKLKSLDEYKIQMVYIFGIWNMQLPSSLKHVISLISGELWKNQHIRFLNLFATIPAIAQSRNDGTITRTLWPILFNLQELTELRILAYYYIMVSNPTRSMLKSIYNQMLYETNEEVYNYHYTFIQAVLQSKSLYNAKLRLKVSQVMKNTPPPSHGISAAKFYGYSDVNHGFGIDIEDHFIQANQSRIYAYYFKSKRGSLAQDEYFIYVKLHNRQFLDPGVTYSLPESLVNSVLRTLFGDRRNHIEGAIFKRNQVVNCYYINKANLHEFQSLIHINSFQKKFLNIRYLLNQRVLIPTDLGFPVIWEHMMPEVSQNNFLVKQIHETYQIQSRHVRWVHFRYGLSFYNPVSDVWQGVNRYHAYDAVLPINIEVSLNQTEGKFSWQKQKDTVRNIAGVRSHVKQMVYVKDDYKRNILKQSSPTAKAFELVEQGNRFRHNYTLLDIDNLDTGHRWLMSVFDSDFPVSNGSHKHQWYLYSQTFTKQINSPIEHLLLSVLNWHHYTLRLPDPGNYGCILRIEPSSNFDVNSIEFSYSYLIHSYLYNASFYGSSPFVPGINFQSNFNYTVGNGSNVLKSWSLDTDFALQPRHNVFNLNLQLTRFTPEDNFYKICIKGAKTWQKKSVTGNLKVLSGHSETDKCVSENTIEVVMSGNPSTEQLSGDHKYASCQVARPLNIEPFTTADCKTVASTVRHYKYFINTNFSREVLNNFVNDLTSFHESYLTKTIKDKAGEDTISVDVVYPMEVDELDVKIDTPGYFYDVSGIPANYLRWLGAYPDNIVFPRLMLWSHRNGWLNHCVIHNDYLKSKGTTRFEAVPSNWTLYLKDVTGESQLYVRLTYNSTLGVKAEIHNHTLEIVPHDKSFQLILDGQEIQLQEQQDEGWIYYRSLLDDIDQSVLFWISDSGVGFQYYTRISTLKIVFSNTPVYYGRCFSNE